MMRKVGKLARSSKELIVLGVLLEASLVVLLAATGLDRGSYRLELFFAIPFTVYLIAFWRISKTEDTTTPPKQTGVIVLVFALMFHGTMLLSRAPLSDDIFRYYWDGKVTVHGINPYAYSPDADLLGPLRDSNWERVQNKDVHTMYPPFAQAIFAAAYAIFPGITSLRLLSVSFSLLAIGVLIRILAKQGVDIRYAILYAWSPLATIEFANSGHIDSLAVWLSLLSFLCLLRGRKMLSSVALGLAVLAKTFPLLFAGLFFPRWGRKGTLLFAAVIAIPFVPFLGARAALFRGSAYFVDRGLFNGSLFPLLLSGMQRIMVRQEALLVSKILVLIIFVCLLALLYVRLRRLGEDDVILWKYSFWLTGAFLLLSPIMHPWYLTWVLPSLCLFRSAGWILLTGTAILARSVYIGYEATGLWREIGWIRFAEYVPPYLLMLYGLIHRTRGWRRGNARQATKTA